MSDAAAVVAANEAALAANFKRENIQRSPSATKETQSNGITIETSNVDDSNFENLGKSLDSGKSQEDIKKEVNSMADQLAKKEAADKKAADEKPAADDDDSSHVQRSKQNDASSGGLNIETSSLADPFESEQPQVAAPQVSPAVAKSEPKPPKAQKV